MPDGFVNGLEPLDPATRAANRLPNLDVDAGQYAVLRELQGLRFSVGTGAAINTNIAITGIATTDAIVAVLPVDVTKGTAATGLLDNLVAEASVTSAGNIQLTTTSTTGYRVLVIWFDKA